MGGVSATAHVPGKPGARELSRAFVAARGRLGLALASGQAGHFGAAAEHRREAQGLFGLLAEDPAALPYPTWLDARVGVLLEPEEALGPLRAA